jgi:hypothetical protein
MKRLLVTCLIAIITSIGACSLRSADQAQAAEPEKTEKKTARSIPFHGKIDAVDSLAKSIKVGERTFLATSSTKFTKAGKPTSFDDAKVGEEVGGAYHENTDGKFELISMRIGPKPDSK